MLDDDDAVYGFNFQGKGKLSTNADEILNIGCMKIWCYMDEKRPVLIGICSELILFSKYC